MFESVRTSFMVKVERANTCLSFMPRSDLAPAYILGMLEAVIGAAEIDVVITHMDLLREAAATGELLVATHLAFPSLGRVALDGDAFRWVASIWDY